MITVKWEGLNNVEIGLLMNMAEDGYCFSIGDGKIQGVTFMVDLPS